MKMEVEKSIVTATKPKKGSPIVVAEVGTDVIVECPRCQRQFRLSAAQSVCRCGFSFVYDFDPT
jgi:hypothetical protein